MTKTNETTVSILGRIWSLPFLIAGWVAGRAARAARLARAAIVTGFELGSGVNV